MPMVGPLMEVELLMSVSAGFFPEAVHPRFHDTSMRDRCTNFTTIVFYFSVCIGFFALHHDFEFDAVKNMEVVLASGDIINAN